MAKPDCGKTAGQIADVIDRFLNSRSLDPQEWNDFVDCNQPDPTLDSYRKRCDLLVDPLVNSHAPQDPAAVAELKAMIAELRHIEVPK
jgi:hypothetical protein